MKATDLLPKNWTDRFERDAKTGLGYDVATTEKNMSNPASITVMQQCSGMYWAKFILRWKSGSESVHRWIFLQVIKDLIDAGIRPKAASIDASNEVFFAQSLQKAALGKCPVHLIKSGEKVRFRGTDSIFKVALGNMLVAAAEDNLLALPNEEWLIDDFRLVKRDRGSFITDMGTNGEHGDTFDSTKLAMWSLEGTTGNVEAQAVDISGRKSDFTDELDRVIFSETNFFD